HEILEARVVSCPGGEHEIAPEPPRFPEKVFLLVLSNDSDHPAHHRKADVAVFAFPDLDPLDGVAANILVPAVEQKLRVGIAQALDLEYAAPVFRRVGAEGRRAVRAEV